MPFISQKALKYCLMMKNSPKIVIYIVKWTKYWKIILQNSKKIINNCILKQTFTIFQIIWEFSKIHSFKALFFRNKMIYFVFGCDKWINRCNVVNRQSGRHKKHSMTSRTDNGFYLDNALLWTYRQNQISYVYFIGLILKPKFWKMSIFINNACMINSFLTRRCS